MKVCYNGSGDVSTSSVLAYLQGTNKPIVNTLYQIGELGNPSSLLLTDYQPGGLTYSLYGTFKSANISRGTVSTQRGLQVDALDITWMPSNKTFTNNLSTTSALHLAQLGYFDNWPVYTWTCYQPTPGDANTLGCSQLFGGRVGRTVVTRAGITFTITSFLDIINELVPTNVIENANTQASFAGATPPQGFSKIPVFDTVTGSTNTLLYGSVEPPFTGGHIFSTNVFRNGYLVFLDGTGATLAHFWSPVAQNSSVTIGSTQYNAITIYNPLPWPPTPYSGGSGDRFYISAPYPVDQATATSYGVPYIGFPYVPDPEEAVGNGAASKDP